MKYIKKFETISEDIKRGDILIDEDDNRNRESPVYLVLDDVRRSARKINVFEIGNFQYDNFSLMVRNNIDMDIKKSFHRYKGVGLRLVDKKEKLNIVENIYSRTGNVYFVELLDKLKSKIGIDIREMSEYLDYLEEIEIRSNAKKYNL